MKQYKTINNVMGWLTFAIAAVVYCMTIEPTASFWDLLPQPAISRENLAVLDVDIPPQAYYSQILVRKNTWISPATEHLLSLIRQLRPEKRETAF